MIQESTSASVCGGSCRTMKNSTNSATPAQWNLLSKLSNAIVVPTSNKRRGRYSPSDVKFWRRNSSSVSSSSSSGVSSCSPHSSSSSSSCQRPHIPSGSYVYTFDSDGQITELQHHQSASTSKAIKIPEFQTTSFSRMSSQMKAGSLESVELDDDEIGNSFEFCASNLSSSSPSSGFPSNESYTFHATGTGELDEFFANCFGYESFDEIELYAQLEKLLNPKPDDDRTQQRGVSRSVTRFGDGYEDNCKFPLVLSCFTNISLLNPPVLGSGAYVTWDFVKMLAHAELCRQELDTLRNLSFRFRSAPLCGRPIDNICPDPNMFLRNLCYQLVIEQDFRSIANREKNRALKRWNSIDDLVSFDSKPKLENEFIGVKRAAAAASCRAFTSDDVLAFQEHQFSKNCQESSKSKRTSLKRTASVRSLSNRQAFQELQSSLRSSPAAFAHYITTFYLEQFRHGFDVQALAQLVLFKNISTLNSDRTNRKLRQTLLNLLSFDDTLVAVIGQHFRSKLSGPAYAQAKALATVIEAACSLRKLENFHGLNVLMGALQSLPVYQMVDGWQFLECNHNAHYRDYCRLSKFARKLDHFVLGTPRPHIPTLAGLINRIRLCCMVSWDLFEAERKFIEHPSIAGWLHTEAMMGVRLGSLSGPSNPAASSSSFGSCASSGSATTSGHVKKSPVMSPDSAFESQSCVRSAELTFNPLTESFLTHLQPVRMMSWTQLPVNWSGRYVPAMPERVLQNILHSGQFNTMFEHFFVLPLSRYSLASLRQSK